MIMTSVFADEPHGLDQWQDHVALCRERGLVFVQVNLGCDDGVNESRLVSDERIQWKESGEKLKQIRYVLSTFLEFLFISFGGLNRRLTKIDRRN